jgi:hypothetical protein
MQHADVGNAKEGARSLRVKKGPLKLMADYKKYKEAFQQLAAEVPALQAELEEQVHVRQELDARNRFLQAFCESMRLMVECSKVYHADRGTFSGFENPILLELEERIGSIDLEALGAIPLAAEQMQASEIGNVIGTIASFVKQDSSLYGLSHTTALDSGLLSLVNGALIAFLYSPKFRDEVAQYMTLSPEEIAEIVWKGAEDFCLLCVNVVEVSA